MPSASSGIPPWSRFFLLGTGGSPRAAACGRQVKPPGLHSHEGWGKKRGKKPQAGREPPREGSCPVHLTAGGARDGHGSVMLAGTGWGDAWGGLSWGFSLSARRASLSEIKLTRSKTRLILSQNGLFSFPTWLLLLWPCWQHFCGHRHQKQQRCVDNAPSLPTLLINKHAAGDGTAPPSLV